MAAMNASAVGADLDRVQRFGLGLFGVGLASFIVGLMLYPEQLYQSYLLAFMLGGGLPVGCLALLMLHHMVGGEWGVIMRRLLEAGTRTFPYVLIAFLPILLFGMQALYLWARPEAVAEDHILQEKAPYLNVPFFAIRTAVYFAIWIGLAVYLNHLTRAQESGDPGVKRRLNNISGIGLVILVLCATFAAFDWSMSTDPHWFSTIFGLVTLIGWVLSVLCVIAISLALLRRYAPLNGLLKASHFHDIGNLMFAFTILWAYMSFSQFLIVWSGNLPEEIPWFIHRMNTEWGVIMALLAVIHFFLPFFLLLVRKHKQEATYLARIAALILVARLMEQIWTIQPNYSPDELRIHWLDIVLPVGFVGFWVALYARELKKRPLEPVEPERIKAEAH